MGQKEQNQGLKNHYTCLFLCHSTDLPMQTHVALYSYGEYVKKVPRNELPNSHHTCLCSSGISHETAKANRLTYISNKVPAINHEPAVGHQALQNNSALCSCSSFQHDSQEKELKDYQWPFCFRSISLEVDCWNIYSFLPWWCHSHSYSSDS